MIRREKLINFLTENREAKLVIISAPAGYGKTMLLADYVSRNFRPGCWLTFDQSDSDPAIFLENLVLSIQRVFPKFNAHQQFPRNLAEALHEPTTGPEICSRLLVNEIFSAIPEDFELVLDDYHIVENQGQINQFINSFLNYLPDNCRVLLSCRSYSPLNLTPLMLRGEVVGLGTSELAVSAEEVYSLLTDYYRLNISREEAFELARQTEGWITGILLSGNKILQNPNKTEFSNQKHLFDYLATEILQHLPPELQRFLLDTSILEYLQAEFCDRLLQIDNSQELLGECERQRLFLTRVGRGNSQKVTSNIFYRLHSLFRDFLISELKKTNPAHFQELHRRSALLFEEQQDTVRMMEHYLQTEDYDKIIEVLLRISEDELKAGHSQTLEKWLEALPADRLQAEPALLMVKARVLSQNGAFNEAYKIINHVQQVIDQHPELSPLEKVKLVFLRGKILRVETRLVTAIKVIQDALQLLLGLPSDGTCPARPALEAEIYLELGICQGINGQYTQAIESLQKAREIQEQLGVQEQLAHIYQCLALAYNGQGDLPGAQEHIEHSFNYWQKIGNLPGLIDAMIIQAGFYLNSGEYDNARQTLEQAGEQAQRIGYHNGHAYVLNALGHLYMDTNEFEKARQSYQQAQQLAIQANEKRLIVVIYSYQVSVLRVLQEYDQAEICVKEGLRNLPNQEKDSNLVRELLLLGQIGLELDRHNLNRAEALLGEMSESFSSREFKQAVAIKRFLTARLLFAQQKHKQAIDALVKALDYAREFGNRPVLKLEAIHCRSLLQFARARLGGQIQWQNAVDDLLASLPAAIPAAELLVPAPAQNLTAEASPGRAEHLKILAETPPAPSKPQPPKASPSDARLLELAEPQDQPMVVYSFGSPRVLVHGALVHDWRTVKASELLFFLLDQGKPVRKEVLIEAIWPDDDLTQADANFRSTLHRLRKALSPDWIKREGDAYQITVAYWYDADQVQRLSIEANKCDFTNPQTTLAQKQHALACYRKSLLLLGKGDYLSNMYSDWCIERQEAFSTLHIELLLKKAELEMELNQPENALTTIDTCLGRDNCNDAAHLLRLRIYKRLGNLTLLTQSYLQYCQTLEKEHKLKPSPEVREFYQATLQQLSA
jgi:LuxR family maltose regulon positive regulatory protein